MRLILIVGIIFGLSVLSVIGKTVKPDKPGEISDATQGKIDKIKDQALSNDWAGIKSTYKEINFQEGDAVKSLEAVAKEIPKNKNTKELRREIKTKYSLLREEGDASIIPELSDVNIYSIQIVYIPTIKLKLLIVDSVEVDSVAVDFAVCRNVKYEKAMDNWSRRWNIALDAVGTDGFRVVPNPRTALGTRRAALMKTIEAKGWTPETEEMWAQYYQDLASALNRRKLLKNRRR